MVNIQKRFILLIFIILFNILFTSIVSANDNSIEDKSNIFSLNAISQANEVIKDSDINYNIPIKIYTTNEMTLASIENNADKILRDYVGIDNNGLLLLIDFSKREIIVNTSGDVIDIISDDRKDYLLDLVYDGLQTNNYDKALLDFVNVSYSYIQGGKIPGLERVEAKSLSLLDTIGASLGGIVTFVLSFFGLKNSSIDKPGNMIYSLANNSNFNMANSEDKLLDSRTTRRRIAVAAPAMGVNRSSRPRSTVRRSPGGGTFSSKSRKF